MKKLRKFVQFIESINELVGRGISWVTFGLVIVVFVDVIMRYIFRISFVFVQEMEWHLFSVIFLIGAGYALLHDEHVRVDVFYQRLSVRNKAWINLLGTLFCLFPGCYLILATSIPFVLDSYGVMEVSPDPGGVPFRFVIKGMIPIGFFLVALQGIPLFLRSLLTVLGVELDPGLIPSAEQNLKAEEK